MEKAENPLKSRHKNNLKLTIVSSVFFKTLMKKDLGKFKYVDQTFIKELTPLFLKPDGFKDIIFRLFKVKKPQSRITIYEEGILLKIYRKYYFCPFALCKLTVAKVYSEPDGFLFYYLKRNDNLQENLEKLLEGDYYYSYSCDLASRKCGKKLDTRHYTKSGKLDKRYSKQNKNTGGSYIHKTYHASENFYVLSHFVLSIDKGKIQFEMADKQEFDAMINRIYTRAGIPIPSFEEIPSYEDCMDYRRVKVVPLLKTEDRHKIKEYLNKSNDITEEELDSIIKKGNITRTVNGQRVEMTREEIRDFVIGMRKFKNELKNPFESIIKARQKDLGFFDEDDIDEDDIDEDDLKDDI